MSAQDQHLNAKLVLNVRIHLEAFHVSVSKVQYC